MIKESDLLQLRKAVDAIHPIGNECFAEFIKIAKYHKLEKNEYFSISGDINERLGFVVNGMLRVFYRSEDGQEHNKHFLLKNSFMTASIQSGKSSITNIQALCSTQLITFQFISFLSIEKKYSQISSFRQKVIEFYLKKKQKREIQLLSNTTEQYYSIFLNTYPELEGKIPYYHIASYLGITPTQLSRIRGKIKKV